MSTIKNTMVFILDGNSQHVAHLSYKIGLFPITKISDLTTLSMLNSNTFNKSKYLIYSICAHRVLSYHLI